MSQGGSAGRVLQIWTALSLGGPGADGSAARRARHSPRTEHRPPGIANTSTSGALGLDRWLAGAQLARRRDVRAALASGVREAARWVAIDSLCSRCTDRGLSGGGRARPTWLVVAALCSAVGNVVGVHMVRSLNVKLFFGVEPLSAAEREQLLGTWYRLNAVRLVAAGGALVAVQRGAAQLSR